MFDPTKHHRRSIRLPDYDYASVGGYFVTICAHQREYIFADVTDGQIRVNEYGNIVQACWDDLSNHYPHVELDVFVVMPNHVHGIIMLDDTDVGAGLKPAPPTRMDNAAGDLRDTGGRAGYKPAPTTRHGLPEIVRGFKTFSARRINERRETPRQPVWQKNYYEHVIRKEDDLNAIREYIVFNPTMWLTDEENPNRAATNPPAYPRDS